jgi:ABC-type antimicrobial peptide transport system permease subunit
MNDRGFGWLAGIVVLIGIAVLIGFLIFSRAVYAFGIFGAFLLVGVALLIFGWVYDRRLDKRYPTEE